MFLLLLKDLPLRFRGSFAILKHLVYTGSSFQLVNLLIYFNRRVDIWLILWFLNPVDNGIYAVVVSFLEYSLFVSKPMSSLVLLKSAADDARQNIGRLLRFSLFFSAIYLFSLSFIAPLLLSVAGPDFPGPGYRPLLLLLPGMFFLNIHQILSQVIYGKGRSRQLLPLMSVALLLNLLLNLFWIREYELEGVALASTLSYTLMGGGVLLNILKTTPHTFRSLLFPDKGDLNYFLVLFQRKKD
jgi:O-antigen/teichoic acid export membrane protein